MTDDFVLSHIKLHNYYLYKDDVTIDFSNNDPKKNLFLFIFPNGGGKTSLFHAIKWGFYGNKFKYYKENKEMKPNDMVNDYARDKGEGFFVEIEFFINGDKYRLRRTCNVPRTGVDSVELITPKETLVDIDAKELLDIIVPSDYGKFFMFDGRDLSSLSQAQDDRGQVDGILKLLGLSSIQIAKEKLKDVKKQYEGVLAQRRESDSVQSKATEEYNNYCKMEKEIDNKLEDNLRETKEVAEEIESLELNIEGAKEVKKLNDEKSRLEVNRADAVARCEVAMDELNRSRKLIHMCLLKNEYSRIIDDDVRELEKLEEKTGLDDNSLKGLDLSKYIVENSLTICPACHQKIAAVNYEEIERILKENDAKAEIRRENDEKIRERAADKGFFEKLLEKDYEYAYKSLIRYTSFCDKIAKYNTEIDRVDREIKHSGSDRVEMWAQNRDTKKDRLRTLQTDKEKLEQDRATITRKKESTFIQMKRDVFGDDSMRPIIARVEFCDSIIKKLDGVISSSIARMRGEVLRISNKFFKDMTNKPDVYDHLEYISDESYLMTIIKKDGRPVHRGSTGEVQIVAMSFLMALSKCSGRTTPIVMDTPMTNLDLIHSQGIERSLKSMPNQILFLAQPAESTSHFVDGIKSITAKTFMTVHDENDSGIIKEVKS